MGSQESWGAPRNNWVRCGGRAGSAGRTQGSRINPWQLPGGHSLPVFPWLGENLKRGTCTFPTLALLFSLPVQGDHPFPTPGPTLPHTRPYTLPPDPSTHWLLCLGPVGKVQKQTIWRQFPRPVRGTHISWLLGAPRVVYLTFLPGQGMALHRKLALLSDFPHLGVQPSSRPPSCSRAHPPP